MPPSIPFPLPRPLTIPLSPSALSSHLAKPAPQPVLIPHLSSDWPAISGPSRWSVSAPDHLSRLRSAIGDDRAVEVELGPRGRGYMDERYKRVTMAFGLFLDAFILGRIPSSLPLSQQPVGYLAQHDIDLHPLSAGGSAENRLTLSHDLPSSPYFLCGPRKELWRRTLWIGPRGSFTPFHRDPYIGIYSQLLGRKRFHLLPPSSAGYLAVSPHAPHTNTSTIPISLSTIIRASSSRATTPTPPATDHLEGEDVTDVSPDRMGRMEEDMARAFREDGACSIDLEAGDSILVPEGWYHSAEGLDVGVGVNAWFR